MQSVLTSFLFLCVFTGGRVQAQGSGTRAPGVLTRAYDNDRSGANLHETVLTRDALVAKGLQQMTTIPVYGDARGTESQPLILPGVTMRDGSVHDVMVLSSLANVVRGVDAETGESLWSVTLGRPVQATRAIDFHGINDHIGVLSTGVVDAESKRVYLVAWVSPDGTAQRATHFVFVLNLVDGDLVVPAVSLSDVRDGTQRFGSAMRKQRSSLLMTEVAGRKTVFFASGSLLETANGSSGWVIAFDVATNRVSAALAMSQSHGAGIWMAGQGLAADKAGFLYGVSGNGSYNGTNDFGESVFKIQYQPPTSATPAWMRVVDAWSPYSDAGRIGQNAQLSSPTIALPATKMAGVSAPTEEMQMPVNGMVPRALAEARIIGNLVYPKIESEDAAYSDEDLGSAGGTLVEPYGTYLAAGKDGIGYAVNTAMLGHTQPADFGDVKANCAKLKGPPVWLTASPGPVDPCPQDATTLNFLPWGKTRHLHATPVQYMSPTRGMTLFVWGENSQLHAWSMSPFGALTYLAQGNETASSNVGPPGGMPGGFCTLSSDGNKVGTAVLWCSLPYGDANATVTAGRLLAYDPESLTTNPDGSRGLRVLWDSEQWGVTYVFNKFMPPTVWNGRVYLPNYDGGVDVYGLGTQ